MPPAGATTPQDGFVTGLVYLSPYIAVSVCYDLQLCRLLVLDSTSRPLRLLAERYFTQDDSIASNTAVYQGPSNSLRFGSFELTLPDLKAENTASTISLVPSADGEELGFQTEANSWCLRRTGETEQCVRSGSGELLATGFGAAIVEAKGQIDFLHLATGGSVRLTPVPKCPASARILKRGVAAVSECGDTMLYDPAGRQLGSFRGLRLPYDSLQMSSSGNRVLTFRLSHEASWVKRVRETASTLLTLGAAAVDEPPNTGVLQLSDPNTGQVCFETTLHFRNPNETPSAAISKDGEHVALAFPRELRLYDLPVTCTASRRP